MKHTDTIEEKLKQSKKYRSLCTETIHRIALWAADRYKGKDAVKAAKNKLHQVFGSYWNVRDFRHMEKLISQAEEAPQTADVKPILLEIMRSHISSLERTEFMEDFYRDLFQRTGKPGSIIDIACGLNPLTLPWMQLEPSIRYQAWDIDTRMTALLNRWFQLRHPRSRAFSKDILVSLPENAVDMIFLFKTLPCLEQQEKGVTQKLLQNLEANYVVVSFPSKTLGGRTKGMEDYYDGFIVEHLRALRMEYFKLEYGNEVFYVIDKS